MTRPLPPTPARSEPLVGGYVAHSIACRPRGPLRPAAARASPRSPRVAHRAPHHPSSIALAASCRSDGLRPRQEIRFETNSFYNFTSSSRYPLVLPCPTYVITIVHVARTVKAHRPGTDRKDRSAVGRG